MEILRTLLFALLFSLASGYVSPPRLTKTPTSLTKPSLTNHGSRLTFSSFPSTLQSPDSKTKLYLDLFGLGPTEIVVVIAAGVLLFGPDRVKDQLREKGVQNELVSAGWRADNQERIKRMRKVARDRRKKRSWDRIAEAIEDGDEETLTLIETLEESKKNVT